MDLLSHLLILKGFKSIFFNEMRKNDDFLEVLILRELVDFCVAAQGALLSC